MTSDNKAIVLRLWYEELWDKWNLNAADELLSDDYGFHLPGVPAALDRRATTQVVAMFSASFPDLKHTVDEIIAEGDTVAARWTVRGTHRGEFQGIPASGKQVTLSGNTIHHLRDGKLRETWLSFDNMELLQQIGALPMAAKV
jgi:steroid delta-isomerase-like uncharacterized protein